MCGCQHRPIHLTHVDKVVLSGILEDDLLVKRNEGAVLDFINKPASEIKGLAALVKRLSWL